MTQYFDHVIINIDPHTFGANPETGEVPMSGTVDGHSLADVWACLADEIVMARDEGMNVVLAMHAVVHTPKHAQKLAAEFDAKTNILVPSAGGHKVRIYPGPFRSDLFTTGRQGHYHPIDQNHPLPKFWGSFVAKLKQLVNLGPTIAFRVGGESLAIGRDSWGGYATTWAAFGGGPPAGEPLCLPEVPGLNWLTQGSGATQFPDDEQYKAWMKHAKIQYRQIELQAAKAIWNHAEALSSRILVGPGEPWPEQFDALQDAPVLGNWPAKNWKYSPYFESDMQAAGFSPALYGQCWKFIYVVHMYSPFLFTHYRPWENKTKWQYQYEGVDEDITGGNPSFSAESWAGPARANPEVYEFARYKDPALQVLQSSATGPRLYTWMSQYAFPPIMVTEFGSEDKSYDDLVMSPPSGGGDPPIPTADRITADLQRARWHYDMRTWFEQRGIGWSVFDCFNGFNVFNGHLVKYNGPGNYSYLSRYNPDYNGRSTQEVNFPQFFPQMQRALFDVNMQGRP